MCICVFIVFNATKSAWLFVSKSKQLCPSVPKFVIGGNRINLASEYTHLGHVISSNLDDRNEILSKRNSLCGKVNKVLCYFYKRVTNSNNMLCQTFAVEAAKELATL